MKNYGLVGLLTVFALAGCESPEEEAARKAQFNGQTLTSVIARIGEPRHKSATKAIWHYSDSSVVFEPIYTYNQQGQARVAGHRRRNVQSSCTYTANLNAGRIAQSKYEGNNCLPYAPPSLNSIPAHSCG